MDLFTKLLNPESPLFKNFETKNQESIMTTSSMSTIDNLRLLNNLSTEEINALIRKYVTFDESDEQSQNLIKSFLILLSLPCMTMFFVLITQHIGIFLKIFIGFLTILHIIVVTYYLHKTMYPNNEDKAKFTNNTFLKKYESIEN